MKQSELGDFIARHKLWLNHEKGGKRLNLHGADLRGADLHGANLREADLREADLGWANLRGADLREADLHGAYLRGTNLHGADLHGADLSVADLSVANLRGADLHRADLRGADLHRADLRGADLGEADLRTTILDPKNIPNGGIGEWEDAGDGYVYGYRSQSQPHMGGPDYEVDKTYKAPVFSTCPYTSCHPGLYLCPTPMDVVRFRQIIRIKTRRADLHSAGGKHRTRRFTVINLMDV